MSYPPAPAPTLSERIRGTARRRAVAIGLALLVEALLVLLLLTLGRPTARPPEPVPMSEFTIHPEADAPPEPPAPAERSPEQQPERAPEAAPDAPTPPERSADTPPQPAPPARPSPAQPAPAPSTFIPLSREQMAAGDITRAPRAEAPSSAPAPARRVAIGPPDRGFPGDSERVGTAPNGQPLYAAAWYREPYDSELAGYLSTAKGPGWGLIACRTVADFRVDSCVALGESPEDSNIARAVLAAAWQFRVRPPQLRGQYQVGEWVRIRIDYGRRR